MTPTFHTIQPDVAIREFLPGDEAAFRRLNEEWLFRHFGSLESKDEEIVSDPRQSILDRGGQIFLAFRNGEAVGCCALVREGPDEYEVAKLAVTESAQGLGIGRRLLDAVIHSARIAGGRVLRLETNQKLTPAIRLYESAGFQHLPP